MVLIILASWLIVSLVFGAIMLPKFGTPQERRVAVVESIIYAAILVWFATFVVSLAFHV